MAFIIPLFIDRRGLSGHVELVLLLDHGLYRELSDVPHRVRNHGDVIQYQGMHGWIWGSLTHRLWESGCGDVGHYPPSRVAISAGLAPEPVVGLRPLKFQ